MSVGIIHLNRESSLTSKFSFLECDRCYHCTTGFFPSPTLLRVCRKHSFKVNVISSFITIAVKLYIFFPGVWALFNAWTICFYLFGFMKCRTMWPKKQASLSEADRKTINVQFFLHQQIWEGTAEKQIPLLKDTTNNVIVTSSALNKNPKLTKKTRK